MRHSIVVSFLFSLSLPLLAQQQPLSLEDVGVHRASCEQLLDSVQVLSVQDTIAFRKYLHVEMQPYTDVALFQWAYSIRRRPVPLVGSSAANYINTDISKYRPFSGEYDYSTRAIWPKGPSVRPNVWPQNDSARVELNKEIKALFRKYPSKAALEAEKRELVERLMAFDAESKSKPIFFADIVSKYKGSVKAYVDALYKNSMFLSKRRLKRFLHSYDTRWLQEDMGYQFTLGLMLYEMAIRKMRTQGNVSPSGNVCAQ